MNYNPVVDLMIGLFLIVAPTVILCWIASVLVVGRKAKAGQVLSGEPDNLSHWVRTTKKQADEWIEKRDRQLGAQETQARPMFHGSETDREIESLIESLRSLRNGRHASSGVEESDRLPSRD